MALSAKSADESSYAESYKLYLSALEKVDLIHSKFPTSSIAIQLSSAEKKLGPYSVMQLKDKILPDAKRKADAEGRPINT